MEHGQDAQRQVSNTLLRIPLEFAEVVAGAGATLRILARAGEDRPAGVLLDDSGWSSYDQFRRVIEAVAVELGGPEPLSRLAESADMASGTMPSATDMLQLLGSPHAHFERMAAGRSSEVGFCETAAEQSGPSEWTIVNHFREGYAPFEAYCWLAAGMYSMIPLLFGYTKMSVVQESCIFRGDDVCRFRVWWDESDQAGSERLVLQQRVSVLERRLEQFQSTVAHLVLADDLDVALERVVTAFALLIRAPGFVLVIEPIPGLSRSVYAHGLDQAEAERVGALVLAGEPCAEVGDRITEITSSLRYYGRLAVYDDHRAGFDDAGPMIAYARLAATALDAATAVEETRREAARGRALLELSAALADITTLEAMAQSLVKATPTVTGSDMAVVLVADWERRVSRVIASHGYPPDQADLWMGAENPITNVSAAVSYMDRTGLDARGYEKEQLAGAAWCVVPITVDGKIAGWLTASVAHHPERLAPSADLEARLRGLAAQASSAMRNAHLVEQIRHRAMHDPLTDLPNRALVLDRADQMLARGHRDRTPVSALFLDLDGFKAINDTLGHDAGDKLLQAVAARLGSVVRQCDTLARLGGDEFVVLVNGADTSTGPLVVAQRLLEVMRTPFVLDGWAGTPLSITTSIGIATAADRSSAGDLLHDADLALYRAKGAGRNQAVVHTPDMNDDPLLLDAGTGGPRRPDVDTTNVGKSLI